ncbi:DUF421 domain-containing protein [Sediminibacillus halophilus]|uniref:Uncharacterized membrane protein YcaP, DUF421 family n=1 Tax=Sediminibacillus halophilus TaxID=482461 RepID=A0A1G9P2V9_9BACI|nr:DUF421 domain-containing protein [Sediminibacillus halophilus]SDL93168.1 Uncharacterized membrane protein YcaP, DUF421 family [Sediminibacillus halophilus]
MDIMELILRVSISFLVLYVLTRIMGRKEISQMTFFNFVSAIAIGSITANLVANQNFSLRNGVLALVGWAAFTLILDLIDIKSKRARKVVTGSPITVVKEGKIIEDAMQQSRLDLDSLKAMLREKNVFSLKDVDYAVFETNGKLSVMKKQDKQSVTKNDMMVGSQQTTYPIATEVITDGRILSKNLAKLDLDNAWLEQQLQQAGVDSVKDVFYAEVQQDGSLFIDSKDNLLH